MNYVRKRLPAYFRLLHTVTKSSNAMLQRSFTQILYLEALSYSRKTYEAVSKTKFLEVER